MPSLKWGQMLCRTFARQTKIANIVWRAYRRACYKLTASCPAVLPCQGLSSRAGGIHSDRVQEADEANALVLMGAVAGGLIGYFGFLWIARQSGSLTGIVKPFTRHAYIKPARMF